MTQSKQKTKLVGTQTRQKNGQFGNKERQTTTDKPSQKLTDAQVDTLIHRSEQQRLWEMQFAMARLQEDRYAREVAAREMAADDLFKGFGEFFKALFSIFDFGGNDDDRKK